MKKLLLLVFVAVLGFGCEGPMGPMGPQGEDGESTNFRSVVYTVESRAWTLNGDPGAVGSYYFYVFDENIITDYVYKRGVVVAYLIQNPGEEDEVQTPVSFGRPFSNGGKSWTEYVSYDYMPGSIAFYIEESNFNTVQKPAEFQFRVVYMW